MKDVQMYDLIKKEEKRQKEGVELIPSENYASSQVRKALSSYFVNKYSEGYSKKRYYGGNENVDTVEELAQERAKKIFGVSHVNVQPYSGSPANLAVCLATCKPGDVIMGQSLISGGHLTHGHKVSATGIFYKSVQYQLNVKASTFAEASADKQNSNVKAKSQNDLFDYEEIRRLALESKPKLIWVGATAYPLIFHYEKFAKIADEVGAYLVADISHVAGLIAGGAHPSPVPHVHIITTTTHKTLRGPRGAMIMVTKKGLDKDPDLAKKIDKAVFPGLQGGPHDNQTAGIAIALFEVMQPSFKKYASQIVKNSQALAEIFKKNRLTLVGNGSENHLILIDLTASHGAGSGIFAQKALDAVGLTLNKNTVPNESSSPFYPSGIRLGTPAMTTRGMKEKEMKIIGEVLVKVLEIIKEYRLPTVKEKRVAYIFRYEKDLAENEELIKLRQTIKNLALKFPIP